MELSYTVKLVIIRLMLKGYWRNILKHLPLFMSMIKRRQINNCAFTALAFLIAVSDPKEKDKLIKIVTNLLK
jgi:hypothetical protein